MLDLSVEVIRSLEAPRVLTATNEVQPVFMETRTYLTAGQHTVIPSMDQSVEQAQAVGRGGGSFKGLPPGNGRSALPVGPD